MIIKNTILDMSAPLKGGGVGESAFAHSFSNYLGPGINVIFRFHLFPHLNVEKEVILIVAIYNA